MDINNININSPNGMDKPEKKLPQDETPNGNSFQKEMGRDALTCGAAQYSMVHQQNKSNITEFSTDDVLKMLKVRCGDGVDKFLSFIKFNMDNPDEFAKKYNENLKVVVGELGTKYQFNKENMYAYNNLAFIKTLSNEAMEGLVNSGLYEKIKLGEVDIRILNFLNFNNMFNHVRTYNDLLIKADEYNDANKILDKTDFSEEQKKYFKKIIPYIDHPYFFLHIVVSNNQKKLNVINFLDNYIKQSYDYFVGRDDVSPLDMHNAQVSLGKILNIAVRGNEKSNLMSKFKVVEYPELTYDLVKKVSNCGLSEEQLKEILDFYSECNFYNPKAVFDVINSSLNVFSCIQPTESNFKKLWADMQGNGILVPNIDFLKYGELPHIRIDNKYFWEDSDTNEVIEEKCVGDVNAEKNGGYFVECTTPTKDISFYAHIDDDDNIKSSIKTVKDKSGNVLYKDYYVKSKNIPDKYEMWRADANGKKQQLALATVTPNGDKIIKKSLESPQGYKTNYSYTENTNGDRVLKMSILNPSGIPLMENEQSFVKLDENHFKSVENGIEYDIRYFSDKVVVKNETYNDFVEIPIGNSDDDVITPQMIDVCKNLPGSMYFDIYEFGLNKIIDDYDDEGHACYRYIDNSIHFSKSLNKQDKLFVLLHELGHYKDECAYPNVYSGFGLSFLNKSVQLNQIYEEERKNFLKDSMILEKQTLNYFISPVKDDDKDNLKPDSTPLKEVIAETNAFLYGNNTHNIIENRGDYLLKYFPRTMAYIMGKLISVQ